MQDGKVDRTLILRLPPMVDGCRDESGLGLLPGSAIERSRLQAGEVVANRALGHTQEPGDVTVGGAPRRQGLDGHASLRIEPAHPRLRTPKRRGQRISTGSDSS